MKMAPYKTLNQKKLPKSDREQAVLIGLVELYLKSGRPIGSETLRESGFEALSSATIRNYFNKMETQGYLKQPHTSGGRIPTAKAFRLYASLSTSQVSIEMEQEEVLDRIFSGQKKEVATVLNQAVNALSELSNCAVFISSPRFDQDFIQDFRLILLEKTKLLSVIITDFGVIHTETIYLDKEIDESFLKLAEKYFFWRISKGERVFFRNENETKLAQRIYNEVMVRHIVGYANFPNEDILRGGLSKLLAYPEFNDAASLANSLSLLEDESAMQALFRKCQQEQGLMSWIGDDLCPFVPPNSECAVVAIPYKINQMTAGTIALLGPMRVPYRNLFGLLSYFADKLSKSLTESVYKHKITFRQPTNTGEKRIVQESSILIEDKRSS